MTLIFAIIAVCHSSDMYGSNNLQSSLNELNYLASIPDSLGQPIPDETWDSVMEFLEDEEVVKGCDKLPILRNALICSRCDVIKRLYKNQVFGESIKHLVMDCIIYGSLKSIASILKYCTIDNQMFDNCFMKVFDRPSSSLNPVSDIPKILEMLFNAAGRDKVCILRQTLNLQLAVFREESPDILRVVVQNVIRSDRGRIERIFSIAKASGLNHVSRIVTFYHVFKSLFILSGRGQICLPVEIITLITSLSFTL